MTPLPGRPRRCAYPAPPRSPAKRKPHQAPAPLAENKCGRCTRSICCTYLTHQIETPRAKSDFDYLLWQVSHRNVEVYKDEDGWFLLFADSPCEHILPGGGCAIYATRPQICRDYANDWCEYDASAEEGFELHFRNYAELLAYCRKRFKRWD